MSVESDLDYCINMLESIKNTLDDKESVELTFKLFSKRIAKIKAELNLEDSVEETNLNEFSSAVRARDINGLEDRVRAAVDFIEAGRKSIDDSAIDFGEFDESSAKFEDIEVDINGVWREKIIGNMVDDTPNGHKKGFNPNEELLARQRLSIVGVKDKD